MTTLNFSDIFCIYKYNSSILSISLKTYYPILRRLIIYLNKKIVNADLFLSKITIMSSQQHATFFLPSSCTSLLDLLSYDPRIILLEHKQLFFFLLYLDECLGQTQDPQLGFCDIFFTCMIKLTEMVMWLCIRLLRICIAKEPKYSYCTMGRVK